MDRLREAIMSAKRGLLPHMPTNAMGLYRRIRSRYRQQLGLIKARLGYESDDEPSGTNIDILADRRHARRWLLSANTRSP